MSFVRPFEPHSVCCQHFFYTSYQSRQQNTLEAVKSEFLLFPFGNKPGNWKKSNQTVGNINSTFRTDQLILAIYLSCRSMELYQQRLCTVSEAINIVARTSNGNLKHCEINYSTRNNKANCKTNVTTARSRQLQQR